jgi:glycosyltransferase involved in cell wall biosynthesis
MDRRKISLCFIVNCDYNSVGGAMTRFRAEVDYFSSKGYDVHVIYSSRGTEKSSRRGGVNYYNLRHIRYLQILYQTRLFFKCLKLHHYNPLLLFIAHEPISSIPASFLRLLGIHPKTILVMHGPMAIETYLRGHKTAAMVFSIVDQIAFSLAGKIVAVSEYERNYALSLKTNPGKIAIIRNGIEFPRLEAHSTFRQEMGIPQDRVTIGYIGSVAGYRGTEFLLKAFSIAKRTTEKPLALVLVFREELTERQKRRLNEYAGSDQDVYISRPKRDVSPVLSTLDIYASHFSKKIDGIGYSIMEAMSSGLPVITGKDEITNRLLKDGFDASLVNKEDPNQIAVAIKKLAEDPSLRHRIGNNAKKTALDEFSRAHMLALCEKEYLGEISH